MGKFKKLRERVIDKQKESFDIINNSYDGHEYGIGFYHALKWVLYQMDVIKESEINE